MAMSTIFVLAFIGLCIWVKKDKRFKVKEVAAVSLVWVVMLMTPFGPDVSAKLQEIVTGTVETTDETVSGSK